MHTQRIVEAPGREGPPAASCATVLHPKFTGGLARPAGGPTVRGGEVAP